MAQRKRGLRGFAPDPAGHRYRVGRPNACLRGLASVDHQRKQLEGFYCILMMPAEQLHGQALAFERGDPAFGEPACGRVGFGQCQFAERYIASLWARPLGDFESMTTMRFGG